MEQNEYELVFLAQEGNEDATNILYQKYKPIIIKKSKNAIVLASHHGIEISDIMQEAFIGFDEAIKNFSHDMDTSFYTFSMLCVDRQINSYLRKITRGKDKILNDAVAITENLEKTVDDGTNIEDYFVGIDYNKHVTKIIKEKLTPFEKEVFDLKMKGYSFEEIANKLERDTKSIYNTCFRIKDKIKKNIKIDD